MSTTTTHSTTPGHPTHTKAHTYSVTFPADPDRVEDPATIDAEIEALEARLKVLNAAKASGPRQAYPKWVYKPMTTDSHVIHHVAESRVVNSKEEEDALEGNWIHSPDPKAKEPKDLAADKKKG